MSKFHANTSNYNLCAIHSVEHQVTLSTGINKVNAGGLIQSVASHSEERTFQN